MYPEIAITPRFFSPLTTKPLRLSPDDFFTPRTELPKTQNVLSPYEQTPAPAREALMAAALAHNPIFAKQLMQDEKRKEAEDFSPNYTMAA